MRLLIIAAALLTLAACEVQFTGPDGKYDSMYDTYPYTTYNYDVCYEEPPYYEAAEYCEEYADAYCCEWYSYSDGWEVCYEEWCVWDDVCGWEYYETIC